MAHIQHEEAYARAVKRNIMLNALKTWANSTERSDEIQHALAYGRRHSENGYSVSYTDDFIGKMARALDTFGKLTANQSAAILKGIDASAARRAEWADKKAVIDASRKHIGTVGEKMTITLTVKHIVILDSVYGTNYLHICEDAEQNIIIYKGKASEFPAKGETATVIATVKEHGVRDGVKQTVIQRPKKVVDTTI
jgi:hypothetical protein